MIDPYKIIRCIGCGGMGEVYEVEHESLGGLRPVAMIRQFWRTINLQCGKAVILEIWYNVGVSSMCMMDEIRAKRDEIYAIARKHKAEKLWVFGSCARREEHPDSDVDFLVKFNPSPALSDYLGMQDSFKDILGRNVDVVSYAALDRNPCFAYNVRKEMSEV